LIRPLDQHLDGDELDALVASQAPGVSVAGRLSEDAVREAQRHVESCQNCDRKVQMHRSAQSAISFRAVSGQAGNGPNCSEETEWVRVAAGLLEEIEAKERMNHAAQCGHCGPLLKAAARRLSDETTPDEEAALAQLTSVRPDWQTQMARTLRSAAEPQRPPKSTPSFWKNPFYWPGPALATASLVILVAAAWIGVRLLRPVSAEQLLAQAYTERRTIEMRLPGAKHAPLSAVERSGAASNFDKPASLLKAETLIGEGLRSSPNDPALLDAKARAELLDGNYSSAISDLQLALEDKPDSLSLLSDLGSAYFQEAVSDPDTHSADYGKAYETLSMVLAKAPDDPVALFNRAIVAEHVFLFPQAQDDWEHYLRIENSGAWSDEARTRLIRLQENYRNWKRDRAKPLVSPSELEKQQGPSTRELMNERVEEYLHLAVRDWLPRAYPADAKRQPDESARTALSLLSETTISYHGDQWLADLLQSATNKNFSSAVAALSYALSANDSGNYDEAVKQSAIAEVLFAQSANSAGVLRSRFERLFALQFIRSGQRCAQTVATTLDPVLDGSYTWLKAQVLLEDSACLITNAEIGKSRSRIEQALELSEKSGYGDTYLRCITFDSDNAALAGDLRSSWRQVRRGLGRFWSGNYPGLRGYSLYDPLISSAEFASQPYLQVAAWQQAIDLIASDPDPLQRRLAHFYLAQAAMEAQMLPLFDREYSESKRLLDAAPKGKAQESDQVEIDLVSAKLEAKRGHADIARTQIAKLLNRLRSTDDTYRIADAYSTLGQLDLQEGDVDAAQRNLTSGLVVTEHILRTLRTEKEKIEWEQKASPSYRGLVQIQLRNGDPQRALEIWEWYLGATVRKPQIPALSARRDLAEAASGADLTQNLVEVASHLPELTHQTVLSYAVLADGLAIWGYDDRGVFHALVNRDPEAIALQARQFLDLCSNPHSDVAVLQRYGRDLYSLLIAPIEPHLDRNRGLVIEADGVLTPIPFEALVDPTAHYLGEKYTVTSSLGLYFDLQLRPLQEITPTDAALVVAVDAPHGFPTLEGLDQESDTIARRFDAPIVLKNGQATLQAVVNALSTSSVFYFAGHALAEPGRTGLVLGDYDDKLGGPNLLTAGSLKPDRVKQMQVAVLAACDTGIGENGMYTDVTSLARALVRAGVPRVITSRWKLTSGATDRLALPFVFPRKSVATARHPYYWACLNQFGGFDVASSRR
jgi:CHAT domain-containing protein